MSEETQQKKPSAPFRYTPAPGYVEPPEMSKEDTKKFCAKYGFKKLPYVKMCSQLTPKECENIYRSTTNRLADNSSEFTELRDECMNLYSLHGFIEDLIAISYEVTDSLQQPSESEDCKSVKKKNKKLGRLVLKKKKSTMAPPQPEEEGEGGEPSSAGDTSAAVEAKDS